MPDSPSRRTRLVVSVAAALIGWSGVAIGQEQARILFTIQSSGDTIETEVRRGFDSVIDPGSENIDVLHERIDGSRFEPATQQELLVAVLGEKYADQEIDLIIAMGPLPLAFYAEYGESLFPGTPVLFAGVRESSLPAELPRGSTGIVSDFGIRGTVELALTLQPDARQLVVLSGASPFDRTWGRFAREQLAPYASGLEISYLEALPVPELLAALRELAASAVVVYTSMYEDGAGDRFVPPADLQRRIVGASAAPVYAVYETALGTGIVGGRFDSFEDLGRRTGRLARRILAGERDIPVQRTLSRDIVDARAMERWEIDEALVPAAAEIMFSRPSIWERRRIEIAAALFLQGLIVLALFFRSRRRRLEQALVQTEDRYRAVVESQSDLVCRYLPDTTLTFVSDAYCRAFGRSREELIGTKFIDLIPESDRPAVIAHVESLVRSPRTETTLHQVVQSDGCLRWQQWVDQVIVGSNRAVELQGVGRDVTELKAAEDEARRQREQVTHLTRVAILGELSGTLAHELNQPLTAIMSNAQTAQVILGQADPDIGEVREILADIVADNRRAGEVISRLRAMLRKGGEKIQRIDVNEVVLDVLALARGQLVERRVSIHKQLDAAHPFVRGDRVQLQQVLLNLVINASEAMAENVTDFRQLTVSTSFADGFVNVAVRDTGHGLAKGTADEMFEPFFTTKGNGLGLGLSICQSIVHRHGGRLSATDNPGPGATFAFSLPAATVAEPVAEFRARA